MERGITLADSGGIASLKALSGYAKSIRDRAGARPVSQESIDKLTGEVAAMRQENNRLLEMIHDKSEFVHQGKHYRKVGNKTTITILKN